MFGIVKMDEISLRVENVGYIEVSAIINKHEN
jgi:hypothetical protein